MATWSFVVDDSIMGVEASKPTNGGGGGNNNNSKIDFKANDKPIIMVLGT